MSTPKKILVAVDYSPMSDRVFTVALELAKKFQAEVEVLHVCSMPYAEPLVHGGVDDPLEAPAPDRDELNLYDLVRDRSVSEMKEFLERHAEMGKGLKLEYSLVSGEAQRMVTHRAELWNANLIVLGTHSRGALARWFLGSVAEFTVRHAHCPVLVVPSSETH